MLQAVSFLGVPGICTAFPPNSDLGFSATEPGIANSTSGEFMCITVGAAALAVPTYLSSFSGTCRLESAESTYQAGITNCTHKQGTR